MTAFVDLGDPENPPVLELNWQPSTVELPYTVGIQGPPGQSGAVPLVVPVSSVSSRTIAHTFDYPPAVRFIDTNGYGVVNSYEHLDSTHVYIQFASPFTGTIVLS